MKLLAGLGNPGADYSMTRHNAGFRFVDELARRCHGNFVPDKRFSGELARVRIADVDCRLLKPTTFMNDSGRALRAVADYFQVEASQILVIHDDIDLPAGAARLKRGGSAAGHNGLRDINRTLGSPDYLRLRIGVGHPGHKTEVLAHVLGRPARDEASLIGTALQRGLDILPMLFKGELDRAMTRLHSDQPDAAGQQD